MQPKQMTDQEEKIHDFNCLISLIQVYIWSSLQEMKSTFKHMKI